MTSAGAADLFDPNGQRKYLCGGEARRFRAAADRLDEGGRVFCYLLALTGCRLSEALALTPTHIDVEAGRVVLRTLKRRKRVYRAVPIPSALMRDLRHLSRGKAPDDRLWTWCRQTAWRRVRWAMAEAGIVGTHASPKGLRHGFGIANAQNNIPTALTQRWMGHARAETTAIYQQAVGPEELGFAARLWDGDS